MAAPAVLSGLIPLFSVGLGSADIDFSLGFLGGFLNWHLLAQILILFNFLEGFFVVVAAPELIKLIPDHVLELVVVVGTQGRVEEVEIKVNTSVVKDLLRVMHKGSTSFLSFITGQE